MLVVEDPLRAQVGAEPVDGVAVAPFILLLGAIHAALDKLSY